MVRGVPTALKCFFVGFCTDFVTSVKVSVASAGVLAAPRAFGPRGPENPKGAPPLRFLRRLTLVILVHFEDVEHREPARFRGRDGCHLFRGGWVPGRTRGGRTGSDGIQVDAESYTRASLLRYHHNGCTPSRRICHTTDDLFGLQSIQLRFQLISKREREGRGET